VAYVLVIGASGGIGRATLSAALDAGHRVRAFSRSADTLYLDHDRLEKCRGDAKNAADIDAALDGIDVVVQALGVTASELFKPVNLFSEATQVLLPAMKRHAIRRLVAVTGFGAGDSHDAIGLLQMVPFRVMLGRAYDDKDIQERLIKNSGLDWTIVRPGILTNSPRGVRYRVLEKPSQWRNGVISRADVADFIVRSIGDDDLIHKDPVLVW
jgi:uncharacterized protein YbjT (DUF2867 family)